MSRRGLLAAFAALLLSATSASAVQADTPLERELQYALEKLTSGVSTAALISGSHVTITPVRTWKSTSGHYCREYEVMIAKPGSTAERDDGVRCRDRDGRWKSVKND
jgi:surface antigen